MTEAQFRRMALRLPGAVESTHMDHPDFRIGGRIFATLGYPEKGWGMVKLTPVEQRRFEKQDPDAFRACPGAWGRRGGTIVHLASVEKEAAGAALAAAFANVIAIRKNRSR